MATNDGHNSRNGGSWRKYFKVADVNQLGQLSPISGKNNFGLPGYNRNSGDFESGSRNEFAFRNYASRLPEVYSGHPNRLERYNQYENMDCDSEVNACLDIIAEFSTQQNSDNGTPFDIKFTNKPTDHEIEIIKKQLQQWTKLNKLDQRIFKLFRNTIKYGDQVFVRDPETFEMYWVDMIKVARIIVNESEGKRPEQYIIRDINPNFQNMSMAAKTTSDYYVSRSTGSVTTGNNYNAPNGGSGGGGGGGVGNSRFTQAMNESCIDSKHVVHLSLNEGLDYFWPFGQSILENIYKVYKQKELLEDSILIYRVQRAPERRLFKIDVGNMPSHMAMAFVERVKNEMHQRRIPTISGGGANMMDASYNALSVNEDYFFPQTCLSLDTSIKLLDNRDVTLANLIEEYKQGKENFVYTVNQTTLEIEPGKIVWADVTRRNTQVLSVLLDNGEKVVCTPDHRFIMRDGSEVEAQHLTEGSSVMPLYLLDGKTGKHQGAAKYLKYISPNTGKSKWVHTMVCPKKTPGKDSEIHHIDLNSRNNNPTNLVEMETSTHRRLHSELGTYHLSMAWNDSEKRAKLIDGIHSYHANATIEDKEMMRSRGKINGAVTWARAESSKKVLASLAKTRVKVYTAKTIHYSTSMAERMVELYNEGHNSITKMTKILRVDSKFQNEFKIANPNIKRDKNKTAGIAPTDSTLKKLVNILGYESWEKFKETYSYNHKIVSVTWLSETIDTGDITVESINNNHNFALSSGIFVHNSDGRGSSIEVLPGGCFSMDTSVSLLDGRELTIAQVSDELAEGKTLWVYSCEPITGKVVPGLVSWAGMTQRQAQVLKITLDNGESIICTPDHKFPQYDVEFKRADELTVGDSLIPLYRKKEVCDTKLDGYEEYFDNSSKQWKYTHRMVADEFKDTLVKYKIFNEEYSDGKYDVRHHVNFNRHDNSPENLCWMAWHDHQKLHQHHGFSKESQQLGTLAAKRRLQNLKDNNLAEYEKYCKTVGERFTNWYSSLTEEELVELNENKAAGLKKYFESLDDDSKAIRTANSRAAFKIANKTKLEKMAKDEEYRQWVCEQQKAGWTSELREERSKFVSDRNLKDWKNNEKRRSNMKELQSVSYSHSMLKSVIDMVKDKTTHEITVNDIIDELNKNINIVNELAILNKDKKVHNWSIDKGFTATGLTSMVKQYGYTSWSDFRKKESVHNHRIAKIEYLDEPMDVGTLTIDGDEIYHGYHTFALSAGVFTKNSNLGEIDDLKYFNNKMARGLRVPSSYLPTGPDDSGAATNDGRVGTALIQEFRFNKYCERLQKLIMQKLDDEFKMYMRWRGFEIDNGLFDITLTEPQNFASYRQSELDTARVATFASLEPLNYLSKRFTLKRFLGLSDEEILENQTLWKEERDNPQMQAQQGQGLRSVGITPGGLSSDLDMNTDLTNTDLGSAEVDTGAGPAPAVVPTPGAPSGGPAGL